MRRPLRPLAAWLLAGALTLSALAQKPAAPAATPAAAAPVATKPPATIEVRLVTALDAGGQVVSDLERLRPVTETIFDPRGTTTRIIGQDAVLWVRSAHIDGKFFFERFYQGKYIGREGKLTIEAAQLGPGEHVIEPGHHLFTLAADGTLASADPNIKVAGNTVSLRLFPVTVYPVDSARTGPPDMRLVPASLGLFATAAGFKLDAAKLPDARHLNDPHDPTTAKFELSNLLSHAEQFYPLTVWLPANEVGQGYLLYPSWQSFQVSTAGAVQLSAAGAPPVAGITVADGPSIVIPHRRFSGQLQTRSGLQAGVGNVPLGPDMNFGATLAPVTFRAGFGRPDENFHLPVDTDFTHLPNKRFIADNNGPANEAVRLVAIEWDQPIWVAGSEQQMRLRLLETPGHTTLAQPAVRMRYSPVFPHSPSRREWQPITVVDWKNDLTAGTLRFKAPAFNGFVVFELTVFDQATPEQASSLHGEVQGCVVNADQKGSASFVSNQARDAFVTGENIELLLVLRSADPRPAGQRQVVLRTPDGKREQLVVQDGGTPWQALPLRFSAAHSATMAPGAYQLTMEGLPPGVVAFPFAFDLVSADKTSPYLVVKPSKYTKSMNNLIPSHLSARDGDPIDLDRAMHTLAELGYNRVDLMTYLTNHHVRPDIWRERLAASDPRLPPPEAVFAPNPRMQMLNACVRYGLEFSDVFLSYNDFALPRYIPGYTTASQRWLGREILEMRASPAMDGMMLYDEMYEQAVSGLVEGQQKLWSELRNDLATTTLGKSPAKIQEGINRFIARPKSQRDPEAIAQFIAFKSWESLGWQDWQDKVVQAGKELAPKARFGTYRRTWMSPGGSDGLLNGYSPDVFKNLDIISHMHYADNSTCWVDIPMIAQLQRTGQNKPLYVNLPVPHEGRTEWDGQYQRMMAFALLAQGANGICMWGLPVDFQDGANYGTLVAKETTKHLNEELLLPFGDLVNHTADGYGKIGIVSTLGVHAMGEFKELPTSHQTEEIWVACWRLGYPAVFLREDNFAQPLTGLQVIFVPGVRYAGELPDSILARLKEAIAAGTKVVVERGSELDLPGVIKLEDWPLNNFYLGFYFPTWMDDELEKVYETTHPSVDYLGAKFKEWGIEPAASGSFMVGPNWRDGGALQYLIMANFDDPPYPHTVKQQMAKPEVLPLTVASTRGKVAYDLLRRQVLPLQPATAGHQRFDLDMTRIQGGLVAFLPEAIARLSVSQAASADHAQLRLQGTLQGASGAALDGVFPVAITLGSGPSAHRVYRTLGRTLAATLELPAGEGEVEVAVAELISGQEVHFKVPRPARPAAVMEAVAPTQVQVPYPLEVQRFLTGNKTVKIVPAKRLPGATTVAADLVKQLQAKGITATVADEASVYHYPAGDPTKRDPLEDGFHTWRGGQEVIGPPTQVDAPVILLAAPGSSYLLTGLVVHGFLTQNPVGGPGQVVPPSLQVARRGLSATFDTLCVLAGDEAGLRLALARLDQPLTAPPPPAAPVFGAPQTVTSTAALTAVAAPPAAATMENNELVQRLAFDPAGNLYAGTWGHGTNLYSLAPDGKLRFARDLPQMGITHLEATADRVLAYTSAGARLYQLAPDGKPISQVRLNMDPGSTSYTDQYHLSECAYAYLPGTHLILHALENRMRLLTPEMTIKAEWESEKFQDKDVSDEWLFRKLHSFALSPDGTQLAQIEASYYFTKDAHKDNIVYDTHLVLRDLSGKLLAEAKNLANGLAVEATVEWGAGLPGPVVHTTTAHWQFDGALHLLRKQAVASSDCDLGAGFQLERDGRQLRYVDGTGKLLCRVGPFATMPTIFATTPSRSHLATLDEDGLLRIFDLATGGETGHAQVAELGKVLVFAPDGQHLALGGLRGLVQYFDLSGKCAWTARLGQWNSDLANPPKLFDASIPDLTEKLWPVKRDAPGDLEALVRLSENRLSKSSFHAGAKMTGETVEQYLGRHVTWVLEFRYKASAPNTSPDLVAGVLVKSKFPDAVARTFRASQDWQFARVVVKDGIDCTQMQVGFQARQGEVDISDATFRRIRFPSVNHLLYEPLYEVTPVVLTNPLFTTKYDPFGNRREEAPNKVMVSIIKTGAMNLVESAFLQNGRLNDVGSKWFVQPYSVDPTVSLSLKEPRWISMVALYFNAYDETNVTPHFDIFATDMETKEEKLVASVRHNGQLLRLVKFPPIKTPNIKIRPVNSIARLRTITEIELYGPLSGQEGAPGFADAAGQNTYMGDFTRVDKRLKTAAAQYGPVQQQRMGHGDAEFLWNPPIGQILAGDNRFYVSRALGIQEMYALDKPTARLSGGRANGIGFTPNGALYGGLLLRGSNDGQLTCINPESGTTLWAVKLGGRLFGAPVAIREDIYAANETGRLYQLDLANGSIMRDTALSGGCFGSLATDGTLIYALTNDGTLGAYRVSDLSQAWKVPVAPDTDSTPAVDQGVVYAADWRGKAIAVNVANGQVLWAHDLGQEFARCPVVLPDRVLYGCRGGKLVALDRKTGNELWAFDAKSRFQYEPLALSDRIVYFQGADAMTMGLDGKDPKPFIVTSGGKEPKDVPLNIGDDPLASLSWYHGHILVVPRSGDAGHHEQYINYQWHVVGGSFYDVPPVEPKPEVKAPPKP